MVFGRVHLAGEARVLPPGVGTPNELLTRVQFRVEFRLRELRSPDQVMKVGFRIRPGAGVDVAHRDTKQS
jgi:hypothetical protein